MPSPQDQTPPMGILDTLAGRMQSPLVQGGLGLLLAASQGGNMAAGLQGGLQTGGAMARNDLDVMKARREMQRQQIMDEFWKGIGTNKALSSLPPEILEVAKGLPPVLLFDDDDRENEGDLVMAAEHVTPEAINFMAKHGRGLICLTLTEARCKKLGLVQMARNNKTQYGTAFTVSIEAAEGVTTGISAADVYVNDDMRRGTELEPEAFAAYEALTGRWVDRVGFCAHTDLMAGASPDGMIGDFDGLIEIKVPRPANHLRYLRDFGVPKEHKAQVTHLLWLTGAPWLDFVSYCPVMPSHLRLYVQREVADAAVLADYDAKVRAFLAEVDDEVRALMPVSAALAQSLEVA